MAGARGGCGECATPGDEMMDKDCSDIFDHLFGGTHKKPKCPTFALAEEWAATARAWGQISEKFRVIQDRRAGK
jgi:hypothetical protein